MKVSVKDLSAHEVLLTVTVPQDRFEKAMDAAYKKLVKRYKIPGFRPGRAPRSIFERQVGREVLFDEATQTLVPTLYEEAIDETKIQPYEQGHVEEVDPTDDGGITFQTRILKKPKIVLPDFKTIGIEEDPVEVSEAAVDQAVTDLRRRAATLVPTETVLKDGMVTVEGHVETEGEGGRPFREMNLYLDEVIPAIREGLTGVKVGEERTLTYEESGKERTGHFKVLNAGQLELPPLDENFAKELGHEGLKEMRETLTKYLRDALERSKAEARAERVLQAILEKAEIEVPDFLLEREKEHLEEHHHHEVKGEEDLEGTARARVRQMLCADAILDQEDIQVTPQELRLAASELMRETGRKELSDDEIRTLIRVLLDQKLTAFLSRLGKTEDDHSPPEGGEASTSTQDERGAEEK